MSPPSPTSATVNTCGELLDWNFRYAQWVPGNGFARLKDLPSNYLRRQVLCTVEGDQLHLDFLRERGRSEMVLWASVYPTSMSSWPASAVAIDRQCKGVSDAVKGALVAEIMRAATASSARSHSGFQSDRRAHMRCSEGVTVRAVANEDGKRS
jgi:hypothetical protein